MLYAIPLDARDSDMSSAVMEALASESYRTVSPAMFETALKVKYASDDEASAVYDILRESMVYYIGRVFNDSLGSLTYSMFRSSLVTIITNGHQLLQRTRIRLNNYLLTSPKT